jgi:hypothetical protein
MKANKREKLNARRKALENAKNNKATLENIVKAILNATKSRCWLNKGFSKVKTSMIKLYYQEQEGMVK